MTGAPSTESRGEYDGCGRDGRGPSAAGSSVAGSWSPFSQAIGSSIWAAAPERMPCISGPGCRCTGDRCVREMVRIARATRG